MLLTSTKKRENNPKPYWLPIILIGATLFLLSVDFIWNKEASTTNSNANIYCDAEQVKGDKFTNGEETFGGGQYQSPSESHSGKYACRLTAENRYGMQYQKINPQPGSHYQVNIWRYATGGHQGLLSMEMRANNESFDRKEEGVATEEADGWEKLELWFEVPEDQLIDTLKIYAYVAEKSGTVYFDDLEINYFPPDKAKTTPLFTPDQLNIKLDENTYTKLNRQRWQAYKDGIIAIEESEQWVKGQLESEQEQKKTPIELRLKGDWLDHLKGEKWSFRIKTKKQQAWNQMLTFSVQHPETRSYLKEWFYHQWLQQEEILAPRYDFLRLSVNGKSRGLFAYEEHFEKQLPELQQRREGVILKLSEDLLWLSLQEEYTYLSKGRSLPEKEERAFEQSEVQIFKENKVQSNPTLSKQFEEAQSLLYQFKYQQKSVVELFDTEKLATYYAITDLMQAYHGLTWHNMRFYYNPVISRLEPIGFDGFGTVSTPFGGGIFIGYHLKKERHPSRFFSYLFDDPVFFEQYIQKLYQFSEESYLKKLLLDQSKAIRERERFLQEEFPDYRFNQNNIIDRGREIRRLMLPKNEYSLMVRTQANKEGKWLLKISNRHTLPLTVIGFGEDENTPTYRLDKPLFLNSTTVEESPKWHDLEVTLKPKFVFFQLAGLEKMYVSNVSNWTTPTLASATQLAVKFSIPKSNGLYEVLDNKIVFRTGKHIVREDIFIPKNYTVYFEAGTELDFQYSAAFISKSPIFMNGTADDAIKIHSSDGTGNGFTILQATVRSKVQYVLFEGWNTLQKGNWQLTGAVNFYESDVDIAYSSFLRNHCEDALNLVRSNFTLSHSKIAETFADGLDADFCEGTINQVRFENTGNDASDFSDSVITIEDCVILKAGDKGVSVGEAAKVYIKKAWIDGAVNGVASKDLSKLTIDDIMLKNCTTGFTAYQKKPEFGSATIEVKNYRQENVKNLYQIEQGSTLILKGERVGKD